MTIQKEMKKEGHDGASEPPVMFYFLTVTTRGCSLCEMLLMYSFVFCAYFFLNSIPITKCTKKIFSQMRMSFSQLLLKVVNEAELLLFFLLFCVIPSL